MPIDTILTIIAGLLGGCNIFQFFFFRAEKKKAMAAAQRETTAADREDFELERDQASYLIDALNRVQKDYVELQEQIREVQLKFSNTIADKCTVIADLRAKVTYLSNLKCYRTNCKDRIEHNPECKKECRKQPKEPTCGTSLP